VNCGVAFPLAGGPWTAVARSKVGVGERSLGQLLYLDRSGMVT
jgi:hypothetical protein